MTKLIKSPKKTFVKIPQVRSAKDLSAANFADRTYAASL